MKKCVLCKCDRSTDLYGFPVCRYHETHSEDDPRCPICRWPPTRAEQKRLTPLNPFDLVIE